MTFSIGPVEGVSPTRYLIPVEPARGTDGTGFSSALGAAITDLQEAQATSNDLAIRAVTGDLQDIHTATLASTRAQVMLELVATVRNKSVEAFNDIMRMQA